MSQDEVDALQAKKDGTLALKLIKELAPRVEALEKLLSAPAETPQPPAAPTPEKSVHPEPLIPEPPVETPAPAATETPAVEAPAPETPAQ